MLMTFAAGGLWARWSDLAQRRATSVARNEARQTQAETEAAPATPVPTSQQPSVTPHEGPGSVVLAAATQPVAPLAVADLVLDGDVRFERLRDLKPKQRVRGAGGKRPKVHVGYDLFVVSAPGVVFDGIDFDCGPSVDMPSRSQGWSAMLTVEAAGVEFRGCSFSGAARRVAIRWHYSGDEIGEIKLADCVAQGRTAVIDARAGASLQVELTNSLFLESGPLVELHGWPSTEGSVTIAMDHVTARGDSAVLECAVGTLTQSSGQVTISAEDCVFDCSARGLLCLVGPSRADALLKLISWSGQGSLLTPNTAMAVWRNGKRREVLAEDDLEVAGLVRSGVDFAGGLDGPLANARVVRWQVPLRSTDPPGANTTSLFVPSARKAFRSVDSSGP
jgi:hypothetical protein